MALVDGHGNFGSIEGDGAAAMRYTEDAVEEIYAGRLPCRILIKMWSILYRTLMKRKRNRQCFRSECRII
ncbi:MAG: hypothetical protein ACLR6H_05300 [Roseburia sp.]